MLLHAWPVPYLLLGICCCQRPEMRSWARIPAVSQAGFGPAPLATLTHVFSVSFSVSHPSSWCLQRVPIQTLARSVPITRQSCHPPWSAQEELETPGPLLSSKLHGRLFWFPRATWCICCHPDQYPRLGWDTLTQIVRDDRQRGGEWGWETISSGAALFNKQGHAENNAGKEPAQHPQSFVLYL